jgi:hypothetical protein
LAARSLRPRHRRHAPATTTHTCDSRRVVVRPFDRLDDNSSRARPVHSPAAVIPQSSDGSSACHIISPH